MKVIQILATFALSIASIKACDLLDNQGNCPCTIKNDDHTYHWSDEDDSDSSNLEPKLEPPIGEKVPSIIREKVPSPIGEKVAPSPIGEKVPSPIGEKVPSPIGEKVPSPIGEKVPSPIGEKVPSPIGEKVAPSPIGEKVAPSPIGDSKCSDKVPASQSPDSKVPSMTIIATTSPSPSDEKVPYPTPGSTGPSQGQPGPSQQGPSQQITGLVAGNSATKVYEITLIISLIAIALIGN